MRHDPANPAQTQLDLMPSAHPTPPHTADPDELERACRWCCWQVRGLGPRRLDRLIERAGGSLSSVWADEAWWLDAAQALRLGHGALAGALALHRLDPLARWRTTRDALPEDAHLISRDEPLYPPGLLELRDPPHFLTIAGSPGAAHHPQRVALVGARRPGARWEGFARGLSAEIAARGVCVISGGALGMDAAAHQGALDAEGPTVVVLPGSLDRLTPRSHRALFERVRASGGALLTEYPPGVEVERYHFPRRNRLIAALSQGVILLRCTTRSGTLLTAEAARQLQRPLGAIPYAPDDPGATGNLASLASGASTIRGADDALALIDASASFASTPTMTARAATPEPVREPVPEPVPEHLRDACARCVEHLTHHGHATADELADAMRLGASSATATLLELELIGALHRPPGGSAYHLVAGGCHRQGD